MAEIPELRTFDITCDGEEETCWERVGRKRIMAQGSHCRSDEALEIIATAEARVKDIQQTLRECLEPIEKWTQAYPLDVFPEPDMKEVRRMLGDTLLTQLSASNMRHVITRVWEMLEQARALLPPEGR